MRSYWKAIWLLISIGLIISACTPGVKHMSGNNQNSKDALSIKLDNLLKRVGQEAPFTISPRYIRFLPSQEFLADMEEITRLKDKATVLIAKRLAGRDPFESIVLLHMLLDINTPKSRQEIDRYIEQINQSDPWPGAFPGKKEILIFLGRK